MQTIFLKAGRLNLLPRSETLLLPSDIDVYTYSIKILDENQK